MSIKEVEKVPNFKNKSYNEMIREDFAEAIKKHIKTFEFEGDYNYKTLAVSAREQARKLFSPIFRKASREVCKILEAEFGRTIYVFDWDYRDKYICISSRKMDDRIHVYATIDYEFADNLQNILLEDVRASEKRRNTEAKLLKERGK